MPGIRRWRWWQSTAWGFALLVALLLPRLLPKAPLADLVPSSRSVAAAGGEILRLTLAADGQFRLWVPLAEIAAPMQQAMLLYEDRWFYAHPGANPWALLRAGVGTAVGGRRVGGSTITMQLARRLYGIDSRSLFGKVRQIAAALWLELRYSKDEILEAYLNTAPFGGNIEGVGTASLIYFDKPARQLSVPEALNLAVIPQNPNKRLRESAASLATPDLVAARQRLAGLWAERYPAMADLVSADALRIVFRPRSALPFRAPHLTDYLLRQTAEREIVAAVNLKMQSVIERVLREYLKSRADVGIDNASAVLVDTSTMQVKALIGSADYRNEAIAGQVNGVFAKRSPGSTLKPFIYGLALDQGLIHSASILRDAPSSFGGFSPENFDGRFSGPVAAQEALIRSRNVPAVDLAARLNRPRLYDFLKQGGVDKLLPEAHYGLALVLGGGELTAEELVRFYAMLANAGQWRELRYLETAASGPARELTLLSPAAARIVIEMLRQTPRPDTYTPARPAVAWKTGTSWGFRDAWTAGVFGRHALVVWVGHFDGASNPGLTGIDVAAPLFLRIVDALRAERLDPGEMAQTQPADLRRVDVCAASGDLPNAACRLLRPAWFIAGKSPIRESTLHRTVLIDQRTGQPTCTPGQHVREEVVEHWSSEMASLFRKAGLPRRQPAELVCDDAVAPAAPPQIVAPQRGVIHLSRLNAPQALYLRAESETVGPLNWFVDDTLLGRVKPGETLEWKPPQAGCYLLRVVDPNGLTESRQVVVETLE
ncbi:penicillin-binding protein 1C [Azonexus sp.]|uniref:penicillin-binding protein 1C n=1 Tax=Azonexus sp. TaxID=1872668 RepID=UPI0027B9E3F6|nr:penicillin-binding protein 1C [Azonexus sp.]